MKRLPSLNGLRAVSITIVILEHLLRLNLGFSPSITRFPLFDGGFGVNVFFVISGFLITSLLLAEEQVTGRISIKNFYIRRIFRIFPAFYFFLIACAYLSILGYISIPFIFWIMLFTYTRYILIPGEIYTAHAWSLSVEENFYFLWPAVFRAGDKRRKRVAFFFVLAGPVMRLSLYFHPVSWISEDSLFTRIDSIAMGCLVALYKDQLLVKLTPYWKKLFYLSLVVLFAFPWVNRWAVLHGYRLIVVPFGRLHGMTANILIAFIMLFSIYGSKGPWFKLLNSKLFNYIGILSYSIYLWQQLFLMPNYHGWWVARFPQNLGCAFLAALFSYYFVEKPFLSLKSRFSAKQRSEVKTPSAMIKPSPSASPTS